MLTKSVKFQIDLGSDLALIKLQTWKKFDGELIINTTFNGMTLKLKLFIVEKY